MLTDCLNHKQNFSLTSNVHLHTKGEHAINGILSDLSMHLVHVYKSNSDDPSTKTQEDNIAVIELNFKKIKKEAGNDTELYGDRIFRLLDINDTKEVIIFCI